jgi:hypothetical protein
MEQGQQGGINTRTNHRLPALNTTDFLYNTIFAIVKTTRKSSIPITVRPLPASDKLPIIVQKVGGIYRR